MHLLKLSDQGGLSLTECPSDQPPPHAILLHTWGADADELTFDEIKTGSAASTSKKGYAKVRFCGEQAMRDGLEYFWVDSCCINKSNNAELSEAIISMFRWYK